MNYKKILQSVDFGDKRDSPNKRALYASVARYSIDASVYDPLDFNMQVKVLPALERDPMTTQQIVPQTIAVQNMTDGFRIRRQRGLKVISDQIAQLKQEQEKQMGFGLALTGTKFGKEGSKVANTVKRFANPKTKDLGAQRQNFRSHLVSPIKKKSNMGI